MSVSADEMRQIIPLEKTPEADRYEEIGSLLGIVRLYIDHWDSVLDEGVDHDCVEDLWKQTDLDAIQVQDALQELKRYGEIYELQSEVYGAV